jgi:dephospho-CoA kinase
VTEERTLRIGLTGPIGCGKSTVAGWLRDLGAEVIDADDVAREVVEPGEAALDIVLAEFGDAVRTADGRLDRVALGRIVFADPAALLRLEAIVHPAVRPRILAAIAAAEERGAPAVVVEAIKLVEGGLAALCHEVWLITCDENVQIDRLVGRGMDRADAAARIRAQEDLRERVAAATTRTLDTSLPPAAARRLAEATFRAAKAAALAGPMDGADPT